MAYANPVDGPRIVPFGEPRLASDKLPDGQPGFRVTQRFTDVNPDFPQFGQHSALDVGNFSCGPRVLAMAAGTVDRRFTDSEGALIIRIAHPNGETTLYAHLNRQDVMVGMTVREGQQIGVVGDTGLGAICHLHVEVRRNGVRVDPWPLLRQNQAAVPQLGDPMLKYKAEGWKVKATGAGIYDTPNGTRLRTIPGGTSLTTIGETVDGMWRAVAVGSDTNREVAYVRRLDMDPLVPGGDPAFNDAVWRLLLSRKASADTTALEARLATVKGKVAAVAADVADD